LALLSFALEIPAFIFHFEGPDFANFRGTHC